MSSQSDNARRVGVDLGGTEIKAGVLGPDDRIVEEASCATHAEEGAEAVLRRIAELAAGLGGARGFGLGVPGLVDRASGKVVGCPNLPGFDDLRPCQGIGEILGIDPGAIHLENDANCAAYAEARLGALRGLDHGLLITLGTGVGGGIVLEGELVRGAGFGGEIGHVSIDPDGYRCGCGCPGCLDVMVSGKAAARRALEAGLPKSSPGDVKALCDEARTQEGPSRHLLHRIGRELGRGIGVTVTLTDVRTVVIGGGFSKAFDLLEPGIREGLAERCYRVERRELHLLQAQYGGQAGWLGAALLGSR